MKRKKFSLFMILLLSIHIKLQSQGLTIPASTYVFAQNGYVLDYSNLVNNGTFTQTTGLLTFAGTTQSITGTSSTIFQNVTVNASSTTTVSSSGQNLAGILLCNGTLNAGSNLTLQATAAQTALIDGTGTGTVAGTLNVQGYVASAYGYHYLSSPFSNETVNQFASQLNLAAAFPTFYSYLESNASSGWHIYTTTSNALSVMLGYAANFGTAITPLVITQAGTVNNGSLSLTLQNTNQPYTQGFNLVGNPYPSPVDWNITAGWTKTKIDNALYFFNSGSTNQYTGTYSSYINNVSSGGTANNLLPAMQAFFVHVTNGTFPVTGTLAINNTARNKMTTGLLIADVKKKKAHLEFTAGSVSSGNTKPLLRVSLAFNSAAVQDYDPAVIYFDNKQNQDFDKSYDALKLMNTDSEVPSFYFISADQQRLSILALPVTSQRTTVIPLGIMLDHDGKINLSILDLTAIPYSHIYLKDVSLGNTLSELLPGSGISLSLSKGVSENRFQLVFSNQALSTLPNIPGEFNVYSSKGAVYLTLDDITGNKGEAVLYNMLGQTVFKYSLIGAGKHDFDPALNNGIYIIQLNSPTGIHSRNLLLAH